ncbi:MAG TPA: ribose 5-phosphate isomerase B [Gemmatimonadales bacterium]|nr:ribose 5-phosphate isomerase B [Gemmatimonadales bacterium]
MSGRRVVTEADVRAAARSKQPLGVPAGAIVTPAARDLAQKLGVALEEGGRTDAPAHGPTEARAHGGPDAPPAPSGTGARRVVALGADHGGYPLKEHLKPALAELGYEPLDLGTGNTEAVDYPDFAVAVARAVADGRAWRGIMIDGAGIGSAMAANKIPGVRAALCYDLTTAQNAREHNDANVLTLGGTLIGTRLAGDIVRAFLATEFGGGRHAKRVDKINLLDTARG